MAETDSRLKVDAGLPDERSPLHRDDNAFRPSSEAAENVDEIPVFCEGGCGEVMGYIRMGDSIPTRWCAACEPLKVSESAVIEAMPTNTDELAELRRPPKDLRKAHFVQVLAVGLIVAGSVYIALGRPIGIYLAAIGTLAWVAVGLVLWRLRN